MTTTTAHLFRVPNRVTNQWIAKTVNGVIDRKCETPGTVTDVEARGRWRDSNALYGVQSREYVVTITIGDGRTCRKVVEVIRGGGVHRLHLHHGTTA